MQFKQVVLLFIVYGILNCIQSHAQKKWTGAKTGAWEHALNWQPEGVPAFSDEVILDNTYQKASYNILMPDSAVRIHSISITPSTGNTINLHLPASNKSSPAIIVLETGLAITIGKGGVFKNSSGLSGGQSIQLNGLMCIYDSGTYVHNSRSAHANDIVAKLAMVSGTATGIFEFDVPGGSYPISLSNRTFGTLKLSAVSSGGTQTYNASGANPVTIYGDLQLTGGVQFNADLSNDLIVHGNYYQDSGIFNVASQPNNNIIRIRGNMHQAVKGIITETSGGLPVIELDGTQHQQVSLAGTITNSVAFRINNPKAVSLVNPLSLPYTLEFKNGRLITSGVNLLTLMDSCNVNGGSPHSFVNGPMKKTGGSDFEFPIGKEGDYAPLKINGTAGTGSNEFVAEYFLENPQTIFGTQFERPAIVRLSTLEYWTLKRLSGSSSCKITLSVGTYSHATALDRLVVARWDAGISEWKNAGNAASAGIATGTVTSIVQVDFGAFTLASTVAYQNPLPLQKFYLNAHRNFDKITLQWRTDTMLPGGQFTIESSLDGKQYVSIGQVDQVPGRTKYEFVYDFASAGTIHFRLKWTGNLNGAYQSNVISVKGQHSHLAIRMFPMPIINSTTLTIDNAQAQEVEICILGMNGQIIRKRKWLLDEGRNNVFLDLSDLHAGGYYIQVLGRQQAASWRFNKQ
ncbi:MAG: hypothetical protein WKF89_12695 [Chitinophagaceae bacterium]